jgi:mono/diheme cytochrome c family protein
LTGSFVLLGAFFLAHVASSTPPKNPNEKEFHAERTPARLARGKYLVEGLMHCFACHSDLNWKAPGVPPQPGKKGAGTIFPDEKNPPFRIVAPNITPDKETGAGKWTDAQFERALRQGIGHDGRKLFPLMPYLNYRGLSDEDTASIIVYLRSIPAVRHELPKTPVPEPFASGIPTLPPTGSVAPPDLSTPAKRGAYLAQLGECNGCHTPADEKGEPIMSLDLAGGSRFKGPWGEISAANITPDASGISYYDEALFLQVMRTGVVRTRKLNSLMLWGYFRKTTDEDLRAIFAHLKTVKPIQHRVDNTESPTYCKLCRSKHGYGEKN